MPESELVKEITEQVYSYLDLCAGFETTPSILAFAQHLKESYE